MLFPIVQAEPGCPDHRWKWEVPHKGAERQLDRSSALPSEQDVPAHPASQSCHLPADSGGYSRNRNNAPQQSCEAANSPHESKRTDATRYISLSLYPVPLTLKLISKTGSQPSPPAWLTTPPRASVTSQPRQQGWAQGRGAGPSLAASSAHPAPQGPAQGSNDPGDPGHRRPATRSSHN